MWALGGEDPVSVTEIIFSHGLQINLGRNKA